ncbi:Scr1 family TA system antitoxin-like transcriptional regulator [Kitasatospora sp. NPDC048722]|uniref:Scr1 family TA system antitoxin-like transcriptional regulator n=1 Tax=Kitasatospora sp. NPDC048722 TaxID=3155639 RepID=UPI0033DC61BB
MAGRRARPRKVTLTPAAWVWLLSDSRERAGLSCAELGRRVRYSSSYVTKVEGLERGPVREFAEACDAALGTGGQLTAAWDQVDWKREIQHPDWFDLYAGLEAKSVGVRGYDIARIWGLLQTPSYARALVRYVKGPDADPVDVEKIVRARLARQERFLEPDGPPLVSVLNEGVIRQIVGGPGVMYEQLQHLLDLPQQYPNINIHVAPFSLGERTGATGTITLIELADGERWAYAESLGSGHMINDAAAVAERFRAYDRLRAQALSASDTARLIQSVMRGLRNMTTSPVPTFYASRHANWKKSTYSEGDGGNCIEVALNLATADRVVPVRDSKDPSGPELEISADGWSAFVSAVRAGEFGTV